MGVAHRQRAEQGDHAHHQRGDAKAECPVVLELRQIAGAEERIQPERAGGEPEQAADQAQRPLPAWRARNGGPRRLQVSSPRVTVIESRWRSRTTVSVTWSPGWCPSSVAK